MEYILTVKAKGCLNKIVNVPTKQAMDDKNMGCALTCPAEEGANEFWQMACKITAKQINNHKCTNNADDGYACI